MSVDGFIEDANGELDWVMKDEDEISENVDAKSCIRFSKKLYCVLKRAETR